MISASNPYVISTFEHTALTPVLFEAKKLKFEKASARVNFELHESIDSINVLLDETDRLLSIPNCKNLVQSDLFKSYKAHRQELLMKTYTLKEHLKLCERLEKDSR